MILILSVKNAYKSKELAIKNGVINKQAESYNGGRTVGICKIKANEKGHPLQTNLVVKIFIKYKCLQGVQYSLNYKETLW